MTGPVLESSAATAPATSVTFFDAECTAATHRLADIARVTPLEPQPAAVRRHLHQVWFKREDPQVGRSYKLRGAFNLLAQLDPDERRSVVVGWCDA